MRFFRSGHWQDAEDLWRLPQLPLRAACAAGSAACCQRAACAGPRSKPAWMTSSHRRWPGASAQRSQLSYRSAGHFTPATHSLAWSGIWRREGPPLLGTEGRASRGAVFLTNPPKIRRMPPSCAGLHLFVSDVDAKEPTVFQWAGPLFFNMENDDNKTGSGVLQVPLFWPENDPNHGV